MNCVHYSLLYHSKKTSDPFRAHAVIVPHFHVVPLHSHPSAMLGPARGTAVSYIDGKFPVC